MSWKVEVLVCVIVEGLPFQFNSIHFAFVHMTCIICRESAIIILHSDPQTMRTEIATSRVLLSRMTR